MQVNDEKKYCGIKTSSQIHESCSNTFQVNLKLGSRSYKGVKLFYETKMITSETVCPQTEPPTSPTTPISTTPVPQPEWVENGITSPVQTENICLTSKTISCPNNYTIVIRETMFGYSSDKDCFYT